MMTSRTTTALASKAPSASKGPRLTRIALALTTALTPVWGAADTLPTGGTVVHGAASIGTPNAGAMTIDQSSDRAVVNWDGFSIGAGNRVTINQPSADAAILNRVTGDTTSQIHGQLNANGRVFVVNPNGIFIGPSGAVNTGSFVASTLGIRTDDFALGNTVFEGDGSSATVSNAGNIEVVTGGYAALIGGQVSNSGTIQAPMGFVGLGSGERITLDLGGDGFMQVAVPTDSDDPALQALIENSGTIQANGGTVQVSAATARNAARHAINMSGVVEARTVSGRNGRVTLGGGGGGSVVVTGKVRTSARRPAIQVTQSARPTLRPARGGDVTITGNSITLAGAEIDASGTDGGGNIRIGGNQQGAAGLPTAETLTGDSSTTIDASAVLSGDGGRVILWSDLHTEFHGNIAVRGGAEEGDGGFAEVSGKQNLTYRGFVDARAPNGDTGELLLDPNDIEIVAAAPGVNQLLASDVETLLAGADLTISTAAGATFPGDASEAGVITVDAPLTWNTTNTLTLDADFSIVINQPITATSGTLIIDAFTAAGGQGPVTTGALGSVNVGTFILRNGAWQQNDLALPSFDANNFVIEDGSFLRVLSGDGSSTPFELTDVYGLQGVGTVSGGLSDFNLANDIDASASSSWTSLAAPVNGQVDDGFVPLSFGGVFDGADHVISGLTVTRHDQTPGTPQGGLFGTNSGTIRDVGFINATIDAPEAGIVAGINSGLIDGVSVQGLVRVQSAPSQLNFGGGIVGENQSQGTISNAAARVVSIFDIVDPSVAVQGGAEDLFIGGIAGLNDGLIDQTRTDFGSYSFTLPLFGRVGGIAGASTGTISNSYNLSPVSAGTTNGTDGAAGSIVGANSGDIENVLANGAVSLTGPVGVGGVNAVVGTDSTLTNNIRSSYFNPGTTTQTLSGQVGEVDAGLSGGFDGARAQTTAELADVEAFFLDAGDAGWNFFDIWALPQDGVDHTRLYTLDTVISAFGETPDPSFVYTSDTTGFTIEGTYGGGPDINRINNGDSGDVNALNSQIILSDPNVGAVTYSFPATFLSNQSVPYDVRSLTNAATVTPATLTIAVEDTTKEFGDTLNFADVTFIDDVLLGTDTITAATVVSAGAPANATIGGSPYSLDLTGFIGTGLTNYNISTVPGLLTVTPRSLTISVNNLGKTYGDLLVFNGTEFSASGLISGDSVTSLSISSAGAAETATVAGGPYAITGSGPVGNGLANYTIDIVPGSLTVIPRPAEVTVPSINKVYGQAITLNNSNFSVSNLVNGDTITSLDLSSEGAEPTAPVAGSPYAINASNPSGSGSENYTLNVTTGTITVAPAPLTITADDQTKNGGTVFVFEGTEFTVSGLLNEDAVTSATFSSAATSAEAGVTGPEGTAILITDPQGTGLENYTITLVNGVFVVAPGNLVITANDLTKQYGSELVFAGTEFSVTGLAEGDSVDSITLVSAGAADTVATAGSTFSIVGSAAVGSGLEKYELVFADGTLTVVPAPLTVTALDQNKQQGQTFAFNGTEFSTSGLVNSDSVDNVTLSSLGAAADAQIEDSPFVISVGDVSGTGLANYDITTVDGILTVQNQVAPPIINPVTPGNTTLPNPPDTISIGFTSTASPFTPSGTTSTTQDAASGPQTEGSTGTGPQQSRGDAEATLAIVEDISGDIEIAIQNCGSADQDFANFMSCLSESLDTYANALDQISNDLPPGFENVSAVIQQARVGVDAAAARAQRRLAGATSDAQRRAIRADAINEARGAINEAQSEIRKAISLIRADDPDVAAVQRETGARIIQVFDTVDSELVRAVEL